MSTCEFWPQCNIIAKYTRCLRRAKGGEKEEDGDETPSQQTESTCPVKRVTTDEIGSPCSDVCNDIGQWMDPCEHCNHISMKSASQHVSGEICTAEGLRDAETPPVPGRDVRMCVMEKEITDVSKTHRHTMTTHAALVRQNVVATTHEWFKRQSTARRPPTMATSHDSVSRILHPSPGPRLSLSQFFYLTHS